MAKKSSRMRRLISGVLSAVMLATLVPSTAFAIGRTDTGSFLTGPYLMTRKQTAWLSFGNWINR